MSRPDQLPARMADHGVDLLAVGPGAHMTWLLGFHPHADERPCLACVTVTSAALLMPALNAEGSRTHTDLPLFIWAGDQGPDAAFGELLDALDARDARRIALDETMRADFVALVQDALPEAVREFSGATLGTLRMRKDAQEYAAQKRNAQIADTAMQAGWTAMRPGMTESDVADVIRDAFAAQGARPVLTTIGAGGNAAFPHHRSGPTALRAGDAVVMNIGATHGTYTSDITRMAVLGTPPEGYAKVHAVVEAAVQAALAAARPGIRAHQIDDAARRVITDAGYGPYFIHRTDHGMGVEGHAPLSDRCLTDHA